LSLSILYVTCKDKEQALQIGKVLVEEKFAGCVNIIENMTSIYPWKGEIEVSSELVLLVKTFDVQLESVRKKILELHSYEIPCILTIPVSNANPEYLDWLKFNMGI
jgi:periplasmic divalent cation tolerance protein